MARLGICLKFRLSAPLLRPYRRSLRPKESLHAWVPSSSRILSRLWIFQKYCLILGRAPDTLSLPQMKLRLMFSEVSRVAVQLQSSQPVCVLSIILPPTQCLTSLTLAWHPCPRIPSLEDEIHRIRLLWCWRSPRSRGGQYPRSRPHPTFRVSQFLS